MLRKNSSDSRTGIIALLQYIIKVVAIIITFFHDFNMKIDILMNSQELPGSNRNFRYIFLKHLYSLTREYLFKILKKLVSI